MTGVTANLLGPSPAWRQVQRAGWELSRDSRTPIAPLEPSTHLDRTRWGLNGDSLSSASTRSMAGRGTVVRVRRGSGEPTRIPRVYLWTKRGRRCGLARAHGSSPGRVRWGREGPPGPLRDPPLGRGRRPYLLLRFDRPIAAVVSHADYLAFSGLARKDALARRCSRARATTRPSSPPRSSSTSWRPT